MRLSTVLNEVDPDILERGRDYLLEGRILSLEQADNGTHNAIVQGFDLYNVNIHIGEEGEILGLECDCPYDYGPICKHEVAVLLRLSGEFPMPRTDEMQMGLDGSNKPKYDNMRQTEVDLQKLLEGQTKESLTHLLLSLAENSPLVEKQIRLHVSTAGMDEEIEEYRDYIRSYIDAYADRGGYVSYRSTSQAVQGAYHIAERALHAFEDGEYVRSLLISFGILEEMLDLMQRADDSNGSVGMVIDDTLERIDAISLASKRLDLPSQGRVFELLLQASEQPKLDDWIDWRLALIESAAKLTTTPERLCEWEQHVECRVNRDEPTASGRGYAHERIVKMRYEMILEHEGEVQATDYVHNHIYFPAMRSLAIRTAMDRKQYAEAIRLAKEGEEWAQREGHLGLVREWKQLRFDGYKHSGELENQRSLGMELVLDGMYSFYPLVKQTYASSEWTPVYEFLVRQFEAQKTEWSVYAQILIDERDTGRLLAYVSQEPLLIEQYYKHLVSEHLKEVIALFLAYIRKSAERASNRAAYRDVCRIIGILYKSGGQKEAREIAQELLLTYPRKPAFRDELMSLWF